MQLSQWALRHRFSARLQRCIRYQPPPFDTSSQSRASVSAPSSWQRASAEANKNLEARRPAFPVPPEPPSAGQPQLRPRTKRKGDTFWVPPALRRQGCARRYWRSTGCQTTRAPGFAQARFNYQAAGACDCPSHLMKAHLPSPALELIATLCSLPNSRFELHLAQARRVPRSTTQQTKPYAPGSARLTCTVAYRHNLGALPQPQLREKKTKLPAAHQPSSPLHQLSRRRAKKGLHTLRGKITLL